MIHRFERWFSASGYRPWVAFLAPGAVTFGGAWTLFEVLGVSGGVWPFLTIVSASLAVSLAGFLADHFILHHSRRSAGYRGRSDSEHRSQVPRNHTIGVLAPLSSWPTNFYRDLIAGIRDTAERETEIHRRRIVVIDVPREDYQSVEDLLDVRIEEVLDGLISVNIRLPSDLEARLREHHVPVLNIHHIEKGPPYIGSLVPDHNGFRDLVNHVVDFYRCRPAILITKPLENPLKGVGVDPFRKEKRDIFIKAATAAGLRVEKRAVPFNACGTISFDQTDCAYVIDVPDYNFTTGGMLFQNCLSKAPPNTAVVCLADSVAVGIMLAAEDTGSDCAERGLRLTGFDNTEFSNWFGLTTVDYRLGLVGRLAYERVQTAIETHRDLESVVEAISTDFIPRRSTNW